MTKVDNGAFFIRLKNTNDIRKTILECSKDAIIVLQRFERFRNIRKQKLESIKKLSSMAVEIEKISSNLMASLPEMDYEKEGIEESPDEPVQSQQGLENIQEQIENMDQPGGQQDQPQENQQEQPQENQQDQPQENQQEQPQEGQPEQAQNQEGEQPNQDDTDDEDTPEDKELSELKKLEDSISQIEEKIKSMG